jgi:KEOPS complex subunit Cgi121
VRLLAGHPAVDDPETFLEKLREVASESDVAVQAFDGRYVAGRHHLERAVNLARRERERGNGIADTLAVEVLCYAAGRRQISDALAMGVDASCDGVVVLLLDRRENEDATGSDHVTKADPTIEQAAERLRDRFDLADPATDADARAVLGSIDDSRLCSFFDVPHAEREAAVADLSDLVAERVALLVVER